jgi:hypothetical protein
MARIAALIVAYFSSEDVGELAANLHDASVTGDNAVEAFVIDNRWQRYRISDSFFGAQTMSATAAA